MPGNHRAIRRRGNHGSAPPGVSGGRRAVPPRGDPDRTWPSTSEKLPAGARSMKITIADAIQRTVEHREIFHDEMLHVMRQIMRGELTPAQIAGFIIGLRVKKETVGEIAAAAQVMREFATMVELKDHTHVVDVVGTGGDGAQTFN